MKLAADIAVVVVALLHVWFLVLEMFLWTTPFGLKLFRMKREEAEATAVLMKNQGLYNGFLAAGLLLSFALPDPGFTWTAQMFFLACVAVAGIGGAITAKVQILYFQALPAFAALLLAYLTRP